MRGTPLLYDTLGMQGLQLELDKVYQGSAIYSSKVSIASDDWREGAIFPTGHVCAKKGFCMNVGWHDARENLYAPHGFSST